MSTINHNFGVILSHYLQSIIIAHGGIYVLYLLTCVLLYNIVLRSDHSNSLFLFI